MSHFKKHCQDCVDQLGEPFEEVHRWLDELFAYLGADHREVRHNVKGVEKARKLFGDEGAKAAEIHILEDEGWIPVIDQHFLLQLTLNPTVGQAFYLEYKDEME